MELHRYKYSVVKMASRLKVSVRSYYDYRNGVYRKRSLQRSTNEQVVSSSFELFDGVYGAARISLELSSTDTPLSKTTVALGKARREIIFIAGLRSMVISFTCSRLERGVLLK